MTFKVIRPVDAALKTMRPFAVKNKPQDKQEPRQNQYVPHFLRAERITVLAYGNLHYQSFWGTNADNAVCQPNITQQDFRHRRLPFRQLRLEGLRFVLLWRRFLLG